MFSRHGFGDQGRYRTFQFEQGQHFSCSYALRSLPPHSNRLLIPDLDYNSASQIRADHLFIILRESKVAPLRRSRIHLPPVLSKHLRPLRRWSSFDCKRAHPALQIHPGLGVRVPRLRRSCVEGRVQIPRMECGRDREDVVVGAVVHGACKGGVSADKLEVADGQGGMLDIVLVATAAVEYGRVEGLCYLLDIRAVE